MQVVCVGAIVLAKFLAGIKGNLRFEIKGLIFHDLCHSFQNLGNYGSDAHLRGVVEGIATYMELTAGYGVGHKQKGGNWYDGYHTTAHFFAWIDKTHRKNFVNLLNQRIGQVKIWNDNFFVYLTRKNVNTLPKELLRKSQLTMVVTSITRLLIHRL